MYEHYLTFAGKNSRDFNVWISGGGTFNAPARDSELITVPGRNGDLYLDNGRYENITVTYPAFITRRFQTSVEAFRDFLLAQIGYKRLEDTYHPDEFRLAMYSGGFDAEPTARNLAGSFDVSFNCKPQRYLKSGEQAITYTASGNIFNPTLYASKPLIRAYGTGTVTINGVTVQITAANQYTDIDCELMDAFNGATNCNGNIVLTNGEFPTIAPGLNAISKTGITTLEITPRWWRL